MSRKGLNKIIYTIMDIVSLSDDCLKIDKESHWDLKLDKGDEYFKIVHYLNV